MEPLRRPLLPDGPLATIAEAEVEKSSAANKSIIAGSTGNIPSETAAGEGGDGENRGRRNRSTWSGRESRPSVPQKKRERVTEQSQRVNYPRPLRAYNIHEEGYGLDPPPVPHRNSDVSLPGTRTSSFSDAYPEESEEGDGIIDGMSIIDGEHGFVNIGLDMTLYEDDGMSTTKELIRCKKTVLIFYLNFLKMIGWRRWRGARQDLDTPTCAKILNVVYPAIIFSLMVAACVTQSLTCFYRDQVFNVQHKVNGSRNVTCTDHVFTRSILANILLLSAYLLGIYLFRYGEPEHLSSLMERVYLSFNFKHRISPQKRLTFTLRMILTLAAIWVLVSLAGNVLRLFSLQLLSTDTYLTAISTPTVTPLVSLTNATRGRTLEDNIKRYTLVIYSIGGFILFDFLYVAVVLSYVAHAQLLLTYIHSVIDKVQTKAYDLGKAIRDMSQIYESLRALNGTLSHLTSLCLFIFISTSISSVVQLARIRREPAGKKLYIHVTVGIINFVQWTLLALAPLTQASRLTSKCRKLRRLGLEIGARPFSYHDTPQLVLDSFLQYTNATRYTAKLAGMPVYPAGVIGFLFIFSVAASFVLMTINPFSFATWF